jgi:hypothetical protein
LDISKKNNNNKDQPISLFDPSTLVGTLSEKASGAKGPVKSSITCNIGKSSATNSYPNTSKTNSTTPNVNTKTTTTTNNTGMSKSIMQSSLTKTNSINNNKPQSTITTSNQSNQNLNNTGVNIINSTNVWKTGLNKEGNIDMSIPSTTQNKQKEQYVDKIIEKTEKLTFLGDDKKVSNTEKLTFLGDDKKVSNTEKLTFLGDDKKVSNTGFAITGNDKNVGIVQNNPDLMSFEKNTAISFDSKSNTGTNIVNNQSSNNNFSISGSSGVTGNQNIKSNQVSNNITNNTNFGIQGTSSQTSKGVTSQGIQGTSSQDLKKGVISQGLQGSSTQGASSQVLTKGVLSAGVQGSSTQGISSQNISKEVISQVAQGSSTQGVTSQGTQGTISQDSSKGLNSQGMQGTPSQGTQGTISQDSSKGLNSQGMQGTPSQGTALQNNISGSSSKNVAGINTQTDQQKSTITKNLVDFSVNTHTNLLSTKPGQTGIATGSSDITSINKQQSESNTQKVIIQTNKPTAEPIQTNQQPIKQSNKDIKIKPNDSLLEASTTMNDNIQINSGLSLPKSNNQTQPTSTLSSTSPIQTNNIVEDFNQVGDNLNANKNNFIKKSGDINSINRVPEKKGSFISPQYEKFDYGTVKSKIDNTLKVNQEILEQEDTANKELEKKYQQIQKDKQDKLKAYREMILKMKEEKRNEQKVQVDFFYF